MNERGNVASSDRGEPMDPFTVPAVTHDLGAASPRANVVVRGTVFAVEATDWTGGPVLEVTLADLDSHLGLVFFGRHSLGGVAPGRELVAAGTVGTHGGSRVILNPQIWLTASVPDRKSPVVVS